MSPKVRHSDDQSERQAAISRLLDESGGMIYGLCLRLTGDPSRAEDLMQETFLQAYRKWDTFRGEAKPSTWLHTIAVRKFLRMNRKRSGEPKRMYSVEELLPFGDKPVPHVPTEDETPLRAALRNEALEELQAAIVNLPSEYRVPLVLKEIVGFAVAEVASMLGLKEGTVKTRLHRARNMIFSAVTSVLPRKDVPPPEYTRRICMDLLQAKQESLDQGVPFPMPAGDFCGRCREVFQSMDFNHDLCGELSTDTLPEGARQAVLKEIQGST